LTVEVDTEPVAPAPAEVEELEPLVVVLCVVVDAVPAGVAAVAFGPVEAVDVTELGALVAPEVAVVVALGVVAVLGAVAVLVAALLALFAVVDVELESLLPHAETMVITVAQATTLASSLCDERVETAAVRKIMRLKIPFPRRRLLTDGRHATVGL